MAPPPLEKCEQCEKVNPPASRYCIYCGSVLNLDLVFPVIETEAPPEGEDADIHEPACSLCGQILPDEAAYCPQCGNQTILEDFEREYQPEIDPGLILNKEPLDSQHLSLEALHTDDKPKEQPDNENSSSVWRFIPHFLIVVLLIILLFAVSVWAGWLKAPRIKSYLDPLVARYIPGLAAQPAPMPVLPTPQPTMPLATQAGTSAAKTPTITPARTSAVPTNTPSPSIKPLFSETFSEDWADRWTVWGQPNLVKVAENSLTIQDAAERQVGLTTKQDFLMYYNTRIQFVLQLPAAGKSPFVLDWDPFDYDRTPFKLNGVVSLRLGSEAQELIVASTNEADFPIQHICSVAAPVEADKFYTYELLFQPQSVSLFRDDILLCTIHEIPAYITEPAYISLTGNGIVKELDLFQGKE